MGDLDTFDLMLLRAAANGELRYFHTDAAAEYLFRWNGGNVDKDTMQRVARLIGAKLLSFASLQEDCPVEITADGNLAVLRGSLR